jgi:hypothetical protein
MKKKFVKLDVNNKVSDIFIVEGSDLQECVNKFNKMVHASLTPEFTMYDESMQVEKGQILNGNVFEDEPDYTPSQEDINCDAMCEIARLVNNITPDVIAYLTGMGDCPQSIKDADAAIKVEQAKIQ